MKFTILFLVLGIFTFAEGQPELTKQEKSKIAKALENTWAESEAQLQYKQSIGMGINAIHIYNVLQATDTAGYAIVTAAIGRYDMFDYLVLYNTNKSVQNVTVLTYRSEHGSEITGKTWLAQFVGYAGEPITYGQEIDAISGATLSGKSMTADIQRVTKILQGL